MYLSANLRAAIEGSTIDRLSTKDVLAMKISYIRKDIRKYIGRLKAQDFEQEYDFYVRNSKAVEEKEKEKEREKEREREREKEREREEEPQGLVEESRVIESAEAIPEKSKHNSVFSFSSPEAKSMHISPVRISRQEASLSSEWEISSEIIET